ncbi:Uncharacterised protein [Mycobacteroides abscessus subsp. abscessus]|nr:Uncharacterised protein [Mycobacteroides abscessus subsp. abscessus]
MLCILQQNNLSLSISIFLGFRLLEKWLYHPHFVQKTNIKKSFERLCHLFIEQLE